MATLSELRTRVRQRTDNENSNFVTDDELTQLINTEYKELYGLLVRYSLQRTESTSTISADGSSSYALPSNFYSLIGVFRTEGQAQVRLSRFGERFRPGTVTGTACQYRLQGANIVLYPTPSSGTYTVLYIPVPSDLSADADTVDGVLGWEELVVINAAIKVLQKEEADTSVLKQDRQELLMRIKMEADAVEFTEDWVVADVRRGRQAGDTLEGEYVGRKGLRNWRWGW